MSAFRALRRLASSVATVSPAVLAILAVPAATPAPQVSLDLAVASAEPAVIPVPVAPNPDITPAPRPPTADPPDAPPADAPAEVPAPCGDSCRGQRLVAAMRVPLPDGWRVEVLPGRPDELARTFWPTRVIELYLRDDRSDDVFAFTLEHEAAHAWDYALMSMPERAEWSVVRGYPDLLPTWYGTEDVVADDLGLPAGDFAESVAHCVGAGPHFRSELGGPPTAEQCAVALAVVGLG